MAAARLVGMDRQVLRDAFEVLTDNLPLAYAESAFKVGNRMAGAIDRD